MKPNQFQALTNLGYIKLYLVVKMVIKAEQQLLSMELRTSSSQSKMETEAFQELLLSYPLNESWRNHHALAYPLDINQLASSFDTAKLYAVIIAYREDFAWKCHLYWRLTDNLNEIQELIDHWADDNDIYVDPASISIACAVPTREEFLSDIADWKPALLLLSDLDKYAIRNSLPIRQDNFEDNDDSLIM